MLVAAAGSNYPDYTCILCTGDPAVAILCTGVPATCILCTGDLAVAILCTGDPAAESRHEIVERDVQSLSQYLSK